MAQENSDLGQIGSVMPDLLADMEALNPSIRNRWPQGYWRASPSAATPPSRPAPTPPRRWSAGRLSASPAEVSGPWACRRCQDSGVCVAHLAEAEEHQLVVIDSYNLGTPWAKLFVFCPECHAGRRKASGWMHLPDEATGVTLDALLEIPQQQKAYEAICAFVVQPWYWVTLSGGYGTGKTVHIYAALNALQAKGIYGQYWTMPDLLDFLKDAFEGDHQESAAQRLKRIAALPVLAVDELDKYNATGWAEEQLQKLFNLRHQNRRSVGTLIAYNSDGAHKVPGFLRSRMADGRYRFIQMNGPDVRPAATGEFETPEEVWRQNP